MTLTDLFSELDKLNRTEKLQVIQHLAHVLENDDTIGEQPYGGLLANKVYEVWSPQDEGNAVTTFHKLLQEHQQGKDALMKLSF